MVAPAAAVQRPRRPAELAHDHDQRRIQVARSFQVLHQVIDRYVDFIGQLVMVIIRVRLPVEQVGVIVPSPVGDVGEYHPVLPQHRVARRNQRVSKSGVAVALLIRGRELEYVLDIRRVHHGLGQRVEIRVVGHVLVVRVLPQRIVELLHERELLLKHLLAAVSVIIVSQRINAIRVGERLQGRISTAQECRPAHSPAIQSQEGRQLARACLFFRDDRSDVRDLSCKRRIERMYGLQVILPAIVRRFPRGQRPQNQQVASNLRNIGEEFPGEHDAARVLAQIGVRRVPRTVLGIEHVQVAGRARECDEDAAPGRFLQRHIGRNHFGIGMSPEETCGGGGQRAEEEVAAGVCAVSAAVVGIARRQATKTDGLSYVCPSHRIVLSCQK